MTGDDFTEADLSGPVVDRRTTMKLLSAAGLSGLAGCTGGGDGDSAGQANTTTTATETTEQEGEDQTTAATDAKTGGRLSAGWFTGSIDKLDPPRIDVAIYFQVAANVFNGLVTLRRDLTIRGDLARDWTVENGGKTFVFDLREGVTFHNGTEFTAEDVRYSIKRTIENDYVAAPKLSTLQSLDDGGVVIRDDYTVELNFEQAMAPALIYLTRGPGRAATVVCKEAIEEMGNDAYLTKPVGTGPFKVTEHQVGSHIKLDAFEDYFETDENGTQLPYLDGIDIQPIPEAATIVSAVRGGDVDFINEVPLQNLSKIEQASDVDKLAAPGVNWEGLAMNNDRAPFDSKDARVGIAKSINKDQFVQTAYFGNALPDTGPINKATKWVWREEKPPDQDYEPDAGAQLLEESGASGASFSILTTQSSLRSAKAIRQQLGKAGLDVKIEQVTSSTYWERVSNADFDATIVGSAGDPEPDQSLYNFFRKPDEGGVWNFVNYEDDEVHSLLDEQRRQLDRSQRKQTLQRIEDLLIADAPYAFLDHSDDIAAKRSTVKGFNHIPFLRNFHRVWLDE